MKLIEAIIRPEKLEPLKDAFLEAKGQWYERPSDTRMREPIWMGSP